MSLHALPDVLIQLIHHALRSTERIALALCCHRMLTLTCCAFAWKHAKPPLRLRLKTRVPTSPLFRYAPLVVRWADRPGVPLSKATTALLDFSRRSTIVDLRIMLEDPLRFPLSQRVFLHPCMQAIHTVVLRESNDEQMRLCLALPELTALQCGSALKSESSAHWINGAKSLTSLSVRDLESATQLRASRIYPLLNNMRLRRLSLTLPKDFLGMFASTTPVCVGLEELRLCNFGFRNSNVVRGLDSAELVNSFLALRALRILTLDTIRDAVLNAMLQQAHWAPALRQLIIVCTVPKSAPSESVLTKLIDRAPALHCELQVAEGQLASMRQGYLALCHAQIDQDARRRLTIATIREYDVGS